ncbi:hypothetical protein [Roseibium sp. RKSG952]|uniref:hypothetical protein n=1 Tax=Roseibium sp. RKSG952 TaxID=2529384 RepID=UPI0012BC369E|nr:hypothetical protein [Roseibium sp. RKSG952]MTH95539.1 hypothetical protein [Roseibium sp. RKSG952]
MTKPTTKALIHLRVPAATKGRWVRASRAAGMRLTDWITHAVETNMQQQLSTVKIPSGLDFSALNLARDPDGAVSLDMSVIEQICGFNGLPVELFTDGPEDNLSGLIATWYRAHIAAGGAPDPVQEDLIRETEIEDAAGQSVSHHPGKA